MIDRLVNTLFRWTRLRKALFEEVHMYDYLDDLMSDPEAMKIASSHWPDIDGWRGWSLNEDTNRYYFNDIPEKNCIDAMLELDYMENPRRVGFGYDELKDFDMGYKGSNRSNITPFRGPIR